MRILTVLRKLLGRGSHHRYERGTSVPVKREPAPEADRTVSEAAPPVADAHEPSTPDRPAERPSDDPVQTIDGIGPAYAERLTAAGVETVGDLAEADAADLAERTGLGRGRIAGWIEAATAS